MQPLMGKWPYCTLLLHLAVYASRFSHCILWAKVAYSNNNPNIITQCYLDAVESLGGKCVEWIDDLLIAS